MAWTGTDDANVAEFVAVVGGELGASESQIERVVAVLGDNWVTTVGKLRSVSDTELQAWGLPGMFAKKVAELLRGETDNNSLGGSAAGPTPTPAPAPTPTPTPTPTPAAAPTPAAVPRNLNAAPEGWQKCVIELRASGDEDPVNPVVVDAALETNKALSADGSMDVVSFIGYTGAGKSYVLNKLAGLPEAGGGARTRARGAFQATSQGVQIYKSTAFEEHGVPTTTFLDLEGRGGGIPLEATLAGARGAGAGAGAAGAGAAGAGAAGAGAASTPEPSDGGILSNFKSWITGKKARQLLDMSEEEQKQQLAVLERKRDEAVRDVLPSLALLLSDVVVLVQEGGATNKELTDQLWEIACSMMNNVQDSLHKPLLIVLSNKSGLNDRLFDPVASTAAYKAREGDRLVGENCYFEDVHFVELPDASALARDVTTGELLNGEAIFDRQLKYVGERIGAHLSARAREREARHRVINERLWFSLLRSVTEQLKIGKVVHMHSILTHLMQPGDAAVAHGMTAFHAVYHKNNFDRDEYGRAVELAFSTTARFCSEKFALMDAETRDNLLQDSDTIEVVRAAGETLWSYVEQFEPCEAYCTKEGVAPNNVQCGRRRGEHGERGHQTKDRVSIQESYTKHVTQTRTTGWFLWKRVKKFSVAQAALRWGDKNFYEWSGDGVFRGDGDGGAVRTRVHDALLSGIEAQFLSGSKEDEPARRALMGASLDSAGYQRQERRLILPTKPDLPCFRCFRFNTGEFAEEGVAKAQDRDGFVICARCRPHCKGEFAD